MTCRPRILVLPGLAQNALIFSKKMGPFCASLGDVAQFVFVDPTHVVVMPTLSSGFALTRSPEEAEKEDSRYTPRAWWFGDERTGFRDLAGLDETLAHLRNILETQGPFDAVWGFSQGAVTASILTGLVERPHLHPIFAAPAKPGTSWPPPRFSFAIYAAGFFPHDPRVRRLTGIETPTLHVLGRGDTIVADYQSSTLIDACFAPRVEYHDGGHHPPTKASWSLFFRDYISSFGPDGTGERGGPAIELSPVAEPKIEDGLATPPRLSLRAQL